MNIKVGGIHYEIFEKEIVENDPNEYGVCVYADNHIEIKSGLSDERKTQTLTHELLHAIFLKQDTKIMMKK